MCSCCSKNITLFYVSFVHCSAPPCRIPGPGLSSSAVARVQQRHIKKSQNRTYSYLQAVDKDISFLSGDSDGGSDRSRSTSPLPSGTALNSSEKVTAEQTDQSMSAISQDKPLKGASDKEHCTSSNIPVAVSMRRQVSACNEESMSLPNEPQQNAVSEKTTSPWRKGRVSELRAVFAKREEGTLPPRPDAAYLSASGRPLSSDESSPLSPISMHALHKEPGPAANGDRVVKPILASSNRFGFVSGNVARSARQVSPGPSGYGGHNAKIENAKPQTAELDVHSNTENVHVGLSVRDRTAKWERRSGIDFDTASHAPKPTLNTPLTLHSGNKADVGRYSAAGAVELSRRKSAGDACYSAGGIPMPGSVLSTKGGETAQMGMPVPENSVGKEQGLEKRTSGANRFSNLPSYAHRFSTSDTLQAVTPMGPTPADDLSNLSVKCKLKSKSALQGNMSSNNNACKRVLRSPVENKPFTTKLPVPTPSQFKLRNQRGNSTSVAVRQVSSSQQPLPKSNTIFQPTSSPGLHLSSQAVGNNQTECAEEVQLKQFSMQKQATASTIQQAAVSEKHHTAAVDCPPALAPRLPMKSPKESHSDIETFTGTHLSHSLTKGTSLKEKDSPVKEDFVCPRRVSGGEELAVTSSSAAFEHQSSTDGQITATGSVSNSALSFAIFPEVPQVCMDDINSDEGSLEVRFAYSWWNFEPLIKHNVCVTDS